MLEAFKLALGLLQDDNFFFGRCGMCYLFVYLRGDDKISQATYLFIRDYLRDNIPIECIAYEVQHSYWWEPGIREPRIKWLTDQIIKLELDK
jgi:hypothetical protein